MNVQRSVLLSGLKRILMLGAPKLTTVDRETYLQDFLKQREVSRDRLAHHEFNFRITSYPEHYKLDRRGVPTAHINSYTVNA